MQASSPHASGRQQLFFLLLASVTCLFFLWIGANRTTEPPPDFHLSGILHTSPPPEIAIELTDQQLTELTEAYNSGFDHPDPNQNDPCQRLQLLPYKKLSAWRKQFRKRGFTMEKIKDMLKNGRREPYTHPEKGVTYTKIYDRQGNWIVVDFLDCLIWQVAPYNFK